MRMIDTDALKDELKDLKTRLDPKSYGQKDGINLAIARIEFMPTIEAEPIIRCKDCKYYDSDSAIVNFIGCSVCLYHKGVTVKTDVNDYCSHAERRGS